LIAADTNILVYAHRSDSEWHEPARASIQSLAEGRLSWGTPWPCVHEFLSILTHPKIYDPPSSTGAAIDQVDAWLASPVTELLRESDGHWEILRGQLAAAQIQGPMVHDARIASICIGHGVTRFLTVDRDFSPFPELSVRNPLLG
jgi:hypothetical protein